MFRRVAWLFVVACFAPAFSRAMAQTVEPARLLVTVLDPAGATIPNATVVVIGLEDATKKAAVAPGDATDRGLVTFENLAPGRYTVQATAAGFTQGVIREVTLRRGDNRHVVALALRNINELVDVGGGQEGASGRSTTTFGMTLSREEIETLSDDPAELRRQLLEMAGPDAIIRVDSFEGAQLPPMSQIKSIHVTRDQFAAEAAQPGSTFVDIITQPGVGALAGSVTSSYRVNPLAGTSQFITRRPPESNRNYSGNIGGSFIKNKGDFSLSISGRNQFVTPIVNQAGSAAQALTLRQANSFVDASGLVNYAVTRDQTIRLAFYGGTQESKNQGVGQYESAERAFGTRARVYQVRIQEAGPIGRRSFQNTRLLLQSTSEEQRSAVEAQTIIVQDGRTTGGAQVAGRFRQTSFNLASDVDYIRGIHSWRAGIQLNGGWFDSNLESGYLGTYTFVDQSSFAAGQPLSYTQTIGDPHVSYFNAETALYIQDDVRISRSFTVSPGVRYLMQTHVSDRMGIAPRFGTTWAPTESGRTTIRFSAGLFYWPMDVSRILEQSIRFDGQHQQQVLILNPSYPDPGPLTGQPSNKNVVGKFTLQRNVRYSAGIDQVLSPRVRFNLLYAYWHQFELWRGKNLNPLVNGVRPDPAFANIIETVTDASLKRHDFTSSLTVNMAPAGANQARFNWRRLSLSATYGAIRGRQNAEGPFTPPPSGTLDTEWGPSAADVPYRVTGSLTSTQLRNLNVNLSWTANAGQTYSLMTGIDSNLDGIINDRPSGVALRSLRAASQSTLNLRASYNIVKVGGSAETPRRYRIGLSASATNLTNRANYGGYSGNMLSDNFMTPTLVTNPRRVDVSLTMGF